MKIDALCKLANGLEAPIVVDLDYVQSESDVWDWVNNEPQAYGTYVTEITNIDWILDCIKEEQEAEEVDLDKAMDKIAWANI